MIKRTVTCPFYFIIELISIAFKAINCIFFVLIKATIKGKVELSMSKEKGKRE